MPTAMDSDLTRIQWKLPASYLDQLLKQSQACASLFPYGPINGPFVVPMHGPTAHNKMYEYSR